MLLNSTKDMSDDQIYVTTQGIRKVDGGGICTFAPSWKQMMTCRKNEKNEMVE